MYNGPIQTESGTAEHAIVLQPHANSATVCEEPRENRATWNYKNRI
jgi:hypothetical protein